MGPREFCVMSPSFFLFSDKDKKTTGKIIESFSILGKKFGFIQPRKGP